MRRALTGLTVTVLLAGCGASAPAAVRPTLAAIEALGPRCGAGIRDNVPSGELQWSCRGALAGVTSTILVDGNDAGVAEVTLVIDDAADAAVAVAQFGKLVDGVPPLRTAPVLKDALAGWTGGQRLRTVGGVLVSAECDRQCVITVMPVGDAVHPLPLP